MSFTLFLKAKCNHPMIPFDAAQRIASSTFNTKGPSLLIVARATSPGSNRISRSPSIAKIPGPSKNTTPSPTPAPLNPTPDPSGKCPDGQIYVSSPLGGGCQTPAKNEGYDIKKIIAEELESFLNKREL